MRTRNICKFTPATPQDSLEIQNFILETNHKTMQEESRLAQHRAFLIRQGTAQFTFDTATFSVSAGSLVFGFCGEIFRVSNPACEYMYISFSGDRSDALFSRFAIHKHNRIFDGFDGLIPFWQDSLTRAAENNIDLAAESMLLYAFSRLSASSPKQNDLVRMISEITEQDFPNPNLSISAIAEELSYNSKYLSHLFKEKMGVGYTEYLRNIRLKYAISLLNHGIDSVKNIAYLSGFSDPLYFSNVFKKTFGMSPKDYRKKTAEHTPSETE